MNDDDEDDMGYDVILDNARLIQQIKDALGTAEDGEALVEVARNAHRAEQELAALQKRQEEDRAEATRVSQKALDEESKIYFSDERETFQ